MAKPEWGTKRTCTTCGARFYDMQHDPIICPKCGAQNEKDVPSKIKRGGKSSRADAAKKVAAVKKLEDEDIDEDALIDTEDEAEEDEDLMEDASDLGEDDEDMAEVIEHIEPGEDEE